MHQGATSELKRNRNFLIFMFLAVLIGIYISHFVLVYEVLNFDGAFNTQAALNLYHGRGVTTDYGFNIKLQTGMPFQVVNGAFLVLFGKTFTVAQLANILFYWLLFVYSVLIARKYRSIMPLLAFMATSLLPLFTQFGFNGYGEVPVLVFVLLGVHIVIHNKEKPKRAAFGWSLLAFAVATKWVIMLVFPTIVLICILIWLKDKSRSLLPGWIVFAIVLLVCLGIQYSKYESGEIRYLLGSIIVQATSGAKHAYSLDNIYDRLMKLFQTYSDASGLQVLAGGKAVLLLFIGFCVVVFISKKIFTKNNSFSDEEYEFLFIALSCVIYFAWWFILEKSGWYRRLINADILLFYSLALSPVVFNMSKSRIVGAIVGVAISIMIICQAQINFVKTRSNRVPSRKIEANMRAALKRLPESYNGFGYGWFEAPRWSYLANKTFLNVQIKSALNKYFGEGVPSYLFFEDVNKEMSRKLVDKYTLEDIYRTDSGWRIAKMVGLVNKNKRYVREIDLKTSQSEKSVEGFYQHETRSGKFTMPDAAAFLDNTSGMSCIMLDSYTPTERDGSVLRAVILLGRGEISAIYDIPLKKGDNIISLSIPKNVTGRFVLYLLMNLDYPTRSISLPTGIIVRRIVLDESCKSTNEYKPTSHQRYLPQDIPYVNDASQG